MGDLVNIICDSLKIQDIRIRDRWGKVLELIPVVMTNKFTGEILPAIRFRLNVNIAFDIPMNRVRSLKRFLSTYNPLMHAGNIARYMASTPRLGENRNIIQ